MAPYGVKWLKTDRIAFKAVLQKKSFVEGASPPRVTGSKASKLEEQGLGRGDREMNGKTG